MKCDNKTKDTAISVSQVNSGFRFGKTEMTLFFLLTKDMKIA